MASYAIPLTINGSANMHHGHGHTRSQHRKTLFRPSVLQRIDSESLSASQLKHDSFTHTAQANGHAPLTNHSHRKSHQNGRIPSPLPSPSLAPPNGFLNPDITDSMLPIAQPSPIKAHFGLDHGPQIEPRRSSQDVVYAQSSSSSISPKEFLTAILIPIPYLLISIIAPSTAVSGESSAASPTIEQLTSSVLDETQAPLHTPSMPDSIQACAITSLILLGVGAYGRLKSHVDDDSVQNWPPGETGSDTLSKKLGPIKEVMAKGMSVGLPIYATIKLSGERVGLSLLVAAASTIFPSRTTVKPKDLTLVASWKRVLNTHLLVLTFLALSFLFDCLASNSTGRDMILGNWALFMSIFIIAPPFLATGHRARSSLVSPLVSSKRNTDLTMLAGTLLGVTTLFLSIPLDVFPGGLSQFSILALIALMGGTSLIFSAPSALHTTPKLGLMIGSTLTLVYSLLMSSTSWQSLGGQAGLTVAGYLAVQKDAGIWLNKQAHHPHHNDRTASHSQQEEQKPSIVSKALIRTFRDRSLLHSILVEKRSRRIFYFMLLNFAFMIVQCIYGYLTHSLGLISDSLHMLFDCIGLLVGLCATVMTKWPSSVRHPYGFGKLDPLAGFANGIFLMFISIEIIYEAIERLASGVEMHRLGELLVVSALGLVVNIIGVTSLHHGHGHSHNHEGIYLHIMADLLGSVAVVISTLLVQNFGWAGFDPLASCVIAVLIFYSSIPLVTGSASKLLMSLPADVEYNLRDTLAGVSGLRGVGGYKVPKFLLDDRNTQGEHGHDHDHSHSHHHEPHTHSHDHHDHHHDHNSHALEHSGHCDDDHDASNSQTILGSIHVFARSGNTLEDVRDRTVQYLKGRGMDVVVQVEREGEARCWCGGGRALRGDGSLGS